MMEKEYIDGLLKRQEEVAVILRDIKITIRACQNICTHVYKDTGEHGGHNGDTHFVCVKCRKDYWS